MTAERKALSEFLRDLSDTAVIPADMRVNFLRASELLLTTEDIRGQHTRPGSEGKLLSRLAGNPELRLRRILPMACYTCGHQWIAPAAGACPKCHSEQVEQQGDERTENAARV